MTIDDQIKNYDMILIGNLQKYQLYIHEKLISMNILQVRKCAYSLLGKPFRNKQKNKLML